eukprot:4057166-Pleurochrysis_carterae.AAC.3
MMYSSATLARIPSGASRARRTPAQRTASGGPLPETIRSLHPHERSEFIQLQAGFGYLLPVKFVPSRQQVQQGHSECPANKCRQKNHMRRGSSFDAVHLMQFLLQFK